VPKLAAVSLVLLFSGHWMLDTLITYVDALFNQIPQLLGG
jgi:flagellar biosynthesis protein FliQ